MPVDWPCRMMSTKWCPPLHPSRRGSSEVTASLSRPHPRALLAPFSQEDLLLTGPGALTAASACPQGPSLMSPQHNLGLGLWGLEGIGKTPGPSLGGYQARFYLGITITPREKNNAPSNYHCSGTNCASGTHMHCFLSFHTPFHFNWQSYIGISPHPLQAPSTSLVSLHLCPSSAKLLEVAGE